MYEPEQSSKWNGNDITRYRRDYRLRIGSTTTATVGIGRQYNAAYHLTVGGTSNFNETRVENDATFLGQQFI